MYWICLAVFLLSRFQSLESACIYNHPFEAKCEAVDEEEFIYFSSTLQHFIDTFQVGNSTLRHIEILPRNRSCDSELIIRSSEVLKIEPEALEGWSCCDTLDFSYNHIRETTFLTSVKQLRKLVLRHNKIEYLEGKDFVNLTDIYLIDLSYNNIRNFSDINQQSLESLNLSHNVLTNLETLIVNCSHLKSIDLSFNKLRDLSTNNFPSTLYLNYLNVDHNELISIDLQTMVRFQEPWDSSSVFIFSNNKIETINMSGNMTRKRNYGLFLDFSSNNLQTVDFIPIVTKWSHLSSLKLNRNKINSLSGYNFKKLYTTVLDLSRNDIRYIEPQSFVGSYIRESLDLSNNKIKYLNTTYFSDSTNLLLLNLSYNQIDEIGKTSFNGLSYLKRLDLSHCFLRSLDNDTFSNLTHLISLNLSFNVLETLPKGIFKNMRLTKLDLSHNSLTVLPDNIFSGLYVKRLDLGYNKFLTFSENVFNNSRISYLMLSGNPLKELDQIDSVGLKSLISLNLIDTGIKKLYHNSFGELNNLYMLYLDHNEIETIPKQFLRGQKRMDLLSLTGNNITDLNPDGFSRISRLLTLNITLRGKLSEGSFRNLIHLKELKITQSELTLIKNGSFKGLFSLEHIVFENSKPPVIEPGAFLGLRRLKELDIRSWFPKIEIMRSYQFSGLEMVTALNLSNFEIHTIENRGFFGMKSLANLSMSNNNINVIQGNAFEGLEMLKALYLSHNKLESIPTGVFSRLKNLQSLYLDHNRLYQLKPGIFSNLNELNFLNLSHNKLSGPIEILQLFPLKNLRVLDINANQYSNLDHQFNDEYLPELERLGIGSNQWTCNHLSEMLSSLIRRNIRYIESSYLEFEFENIDGIRCNY